MTSKELMEAHPRLHLKAHKYAWDKTCEIYDRHDGYLSYEQTKLYEIIYQAWMAGKGIEYEIPTEVSKEKVAFSSKYYHF